MKMCEGMKMCRDLKIQSQASKSKAKYEVGNFCTQYGLPSIASSEKFHRKRTASKYYRKQKSSHFKEMIFGLNMVVYLESLFQGPRRLIDLMGGNLRDIPIS